MDKIIIENLEIIAEHGVFKEEKFLGQKFIVSLEMKTDTREAGKTGKQRDHSADGTCGKGTGIRPCVDPGL